MIDMKIPNEDLIATITYFFMFIIDQMLICGQIESWVSIIDVNQMGLLSFAGVKCVFKAGFEDSHQFLIVDISE